MKSQTAKSSNVPGWMVTFADLMALMMTFFVLLYSFSSVDEAKYRHVVDSMAQGFGAQWIKRDKAMPGVSGTEAGIISTPIQLPFYYSEDDHPEPQPGNHNKTADSQNTPLANKLLREISGEINAGLISVVSNQQKLVIRLSEQAAFPSGSADINPEFMPVLLRIARLLEDGKEKIEVAGHTDDRPILNAHFKSNWELSTARAVSMVHLILQNTGIDKQRITASGYADTRPLTPNSSDEARSKNRRVEIIILQNGTDK